MATHNWLLQTGALELGGAAAWIVVHWLRAKGVEPISRAESRGEAIG